MRSGRVVLMDFHAGSIAATPHAGDLVGTPMCLAPEILVDGRPASVQSDIYSAAVLAFRLLTAAYPVSAESLDALRIAHRTRAPVSVRSTRPDVPERLAAALERGLAPSPVDRPSEREGRSAAALPRVSTPARGAAFRCSGGPPRRRWS